MRNSGDIAGDLSKGTLISILVSSSPMIEDVFVLIPISLLAPQAFQGHESVYARLQIALGSNCPDTAGWLILLIFASLFCSFLFHLWSEAVAQALKNEDKWLGCKEWQEGVTNRGWTAEPFVSVRPIAAGNSQNQPSWLAKNILQFNSLAIFPSDWLPSVLLELVEFLQLKVRLRQSNQDQERRKASEQWRGEIRCQPLGTFWFYHAIGD